MVRSSCLTQILHLLDNQRLVRHQRLIRLQKSMTSRFLSKLNNCRLDRAIVASCLLSVFVGCASHSKQKGEGAVAHAPIYQEMRATNVDGEMITVNRTVVGWTDYVDYSDKSKTP